MVPFSFGGHTLLALPQGALFWPSRGALLVADLHFEKASWYAKSGQMLPPYDSIATLADLTAVVDATCAREVWCLGDSFHDSDGCARLPDRAQDMLRALRQPIASVGVVETVAEAPDLVRARRRDQRGQVGERRDRIIGRQHLPAQCEPARLLEM